MDLLSKEERAAIQERANEASLRIGTPRQRHNGDPTKGPDVDAVALWGGDSVRKHVHNHDSEREW